MFGRDNKELPELVVACSGATTEQEFIAAATFTTSKPGYVFKKGVKGLGYYKDARAACNNAQAAHNGAAKLVRSLEEWDELQAADGRTYYYNKSSLTTQWEVPR